MVSEIYSPPRITAAAKMLPNLKMTPGLAMVQDDQGKPMTSTRPKSGTGRVRCGDEKTNVPSGKPHVLCILRVASHQRRKSLP